MGTLAVDNIQHTDGSSAVTLNNATMTTGTLGSGITFPAGHIIRVSTYEIGQGTNTKADFPEDNTIPQRSEGTEVFSQAYTPSGSNVDLIIEFDIQIVETSNVDYAVQVGLFISDNNDALRVCDDNNGDAGYSLNNSNFSASYKMASWGVTEKTFSLRSGAGQAYNLGAEYVGARTQIYGVSRKTLFKIWEVVS